MRPSTTGPLRQRFVQLTNPAEPAFDTPLSDQASLPCLGTSCFYIRRCLAGGSKPSKFPCRLMMLDFNARYGGASVWCHSGPAAQSLPFGGRLLFIKQHHHQLSWPASPARRSEPCPFNRSASASALHSSPSPPPTGKPC